MHTITRRDIVAFLLGAVSAVIAFGVIVSLIVSMFGAQVVTHYAPQPTFAVQPTFEHQPTFIAQPTFLIEPTFTFTPTSTPTRTPSPTRTPTSTTTNTVAPTSDPHAGVEFGATIAIRADGPNENQRSVAVWDDNVLYIYSSSSEKVEYSYGDGFTTAKAEAAYATCTFTMASLRNVVINRCKVYVIGDHPTAFRAPGLVNDYQFYASALAGGTTQYSQFATPVPSATQTLTPEATPTP